jgi:pyruvate kinase
MPGGLPATITTICPWGIETFQTPRVEHTDEMVMQVDRALLEIDRIPQGQMVVIVAGSPPGIAGSTNALRIHCMGDAINEVAPAYKSGAPAP